MTEAQIYILLEHKSYSDRWAILHILRYMIQRWSRDTKDNPSNALVPILPILFYHGEDRGEAIGKHAEKLAIALNMKTLGFSVQQICQATGLFEEEVLKL